MLLNMRGCSAAATVALVCVALAACSGGGGGGATTATSATATSPITTAPTTTTPTATVTPPPATATPASVSSVLTVDFAGLANYSNPALPAYYDAAVRGADNTPANNAITDRIATLGRVLFYDKKLSVNDQVACASCHQQSNGFDDPARFSTGFSGSAFTTAHAMRLGNVRYYQPGTMFWNKRAASVEGQATQPVQNPIEMGYDAAHGGIAALLAKLSATTYYPDLFTFAFGDPAVSEARIQQALAQFERAIISSSSRWDSAYAQVFNAAGPNRNLDTPLAGLTATEDRGRHLFMGNRGAGGLECAECHVPPTFALVGNSGSNGLDAGETVRFKAPSLKNVGLGQAFMHDGRFSTLEQVIDHYDTGVLAGPALDNRLQANNGPRRLNLSAADKAALAAFLRTLTDPSLTTDPRFSSPFR